MQMSFAAPSTLRVQAGWQLQPLMHTHINARTRKPSHTASHTQKETKNTTAHAPGGLQHVHHAAVTVARGAPHALVLAGGRCGRVVAQNEVHLWV